MKFLSVSNIVIAPANTGRDKTNSTAVTNIDQTNKGILSIVIPGALMLSIVVMKLMEANIEETPPRCKLNIAMSTEPPEWACIELSGG